jgi:hypothetical protein
MLKKVCSVVLSALLMQAAAAPALAGTKAEEEARRAEKVRTQLAKIGTGKDALVKLELRDKTKVVGFVSEVGANTFAVTDASGKSTTVAYPQVKKVRGHNLSTGAKIAIGAGIAAAIILLILWNEYSENEGG